MIFYAILYEINEMKIYKEINMFFLFKIKFNLQLNQKVSIHHSIL